MVWGFLHFGTVWPFYFQFKKRFDFVLLTIASIVPDLEALVLFPLTNGNSTRLVLHSIAGSILIGIPITLFLGFVVFPRIYKKFRAFFEKNFEPTLFNQKTKIISLKSFNSIIFGLLSHVIIDTAMLHEGKASPLFFPFSNQTTLIPLFGNATLSLITMTLLALIAIIYYATKIIKKRK